MQGITIAHDGEGYILRNQRCPKDLSTMMPATKAIFNIPCSKNILAKDVRKFYLSKLALLVILLINNYNYNINRVDLAD
jgi:hypothetical protein